MTMMPHVCAPPRYLSGCHRCQLLIAEANANNFDGWTVLAADAAAQAAQTAAEAAVAAASAAAQAATAAIMSHVDVDFSGILVGVNCCNVYASRYSATVPFPTQRMTGPDATWRRVQGEETWHGETQEWHGRQDQDGCMGTGTVRSLWCNQKTGGSAAKSCHVNNKQRYHWKVQRTGGQGRQGVGGGKAKHGQPRRDPWYRPQQPRGTRSNQKQTRFHPGKAGVSRATQTTYDQGTQTVSARNSNDIAFSAAEEIMTRCLQPEAEMPQIFLLTGCDSDDDEAAFFPDSLPGGSKSRWPQLLDGATTVSSVSSGDNFSQDSDEDNTMAEEKPEDDTNDKEVSFGAFYWRHSLAAFA